MSLPGLVAEWVTQRASPAEVYAAVPVLIRGSFPLFADILESEKLTSGMVDDFEHFLRVRKKCANNAAVKYIRYLKNVVRVGIANKWIDDDPFIGKRYTRTKTEREFLTEDELKAIMKLDLSALPRLDLVRDTFVFCCFCGLAFVDISTLTRDQIVTDENGEEWIRKARQKTGEVSTTPQTLTSEKDTINTV